MKWILYLSFEFVMIYTVQIKRNPFEPNVDYTFADTYLQGCERQFDTKKQAVSYLNTFEDWEQDLLCIDSFPFWVPGVMPGDQIPHSALPTAEMGTALLLNVMQLNFNQADFLMHCIDLFCVDFGAGTPASFTDIEGKEVILDHKQIEDLYLKIQEFKFVDNWSVQAGG